MQRTTRVSAPAKKSSIRQAGAKRRPNLRLPVAPAIEPTRSTSFELALRILNEFGGNALELGVQEISDRCGVHKSQISKVLTALAKHDYVVKNPATGNYCVGTRLFVLGSRYLMSDRLSREAMPLMKDLSEESGHSVRLSIQAGKIVVYLAAVEGHLLFDSERRVGAVLPWHGASACRILLAFKSKADQDQIFTEFGMPKLTEHTITDRKVLDKAIEAARRDGFAVSRNQSTHALGTISVPIFDGSGCIASLSLAFPNHVVRTDQEGPLVEILHDCARRLSLRLGARAYPYGFGKQMQKRRLPESTRVTG